jgi:hypothetical protein
MNQNICIPSSFFFIFIIFLIILTIIYLYHTHQNNNLKIILQESDTNQSKQTNYLYKTNNINIDSLPIKQLLENRDRSVLYDPLVAPERRIDISQYPNNINNINNINIETRGQTDNYQLVGIATRSTDEKIIQLYGRPTFPRSNQYEYYVINSTDGFVTKIPINVRGKKEILDNDTINVHRLGDFQVKIYDYNTLKYNPYII